MTGGNDHKEYRIERIGLHNMADMEKLYGNVYGRKSLKDHYLKKFATGYTGVEYAGFIAYDGDKPIASLCLVPCFMIHDNKRMLAAQLTDGMTDPASRKSGLFGKLADEVVTLAANLGIQLIFGFPNQDAAPLLIKKGWEQVERMNRFVIPVKRSWRWFVNNLFKWKRKKTSLPAGCASSILKNGYAGVERCSDYVLYKSFTNTMLETNAGSKAWIKTGNDLAIGDMEVSEDNFDEMIGIIHARAIETGADKIFFQSSPGTELHQLFLQRYEAIPSFPVVVKKLGGEMPGSIGFTFADIDIF